MTRGEVKDRVRANLDDAAVTFFTATDLEDSIQDAYYYVSCFANSIEKSVNISFTTANPYYNLLEIIPDYFALTGVFDIARKKFLQYRSRLEMMAMRADYEVWSGPPEYFFVHGQARLFIAPQPPNIASATQTADNDLKIFYRAFSDDVAADAHVYELPTQGEDCLEYYATADLLEQAQEWSKAQLYWDKFHQQLIASKIAIRDRPMPALINGLAAVKL